MRSELCIYDLTSDETRVVLDAVDHIEAPNWHPEGYLIVNGGGRMFRVDMSVPTLVPLDTGFAVHCNNDHGISPDGQTLAISDKTEDGESCIYTLPVRGGPPERFTDAVPSWFHGWSPDGGAITYVGAQRTDRVVRLYTKAMGGTERLVCDGFDHVDGPDFSADGQWIWFNGERDGAVNIWRVRPDGHDLEQMTSGESVDWFPHPSPCGQHVVYLAYPAGTEGHPADLNVTLRLMPQSGGTSREICRLFGGQGTINVPSWSPDGTAFAFVRYVPEASS